MTINKSSIKFGKIQNYGILIVGVLLNKKQRNFKLFSVIAVMLSAFFSVYLYVPKFFGDSVYPLKYQSSIVKYSKECNVDPALVAAVIMQESRFNPDAVSPAGAQGLMQFMPGTARTMANELGVTSYNIFDPIISIRFGACHIRDLLIKYNGNTDAALAGYNAGTGNADKWVRLGILGNIPFRETNNYVKKVTNYRNVYRTMYANELGLEPIKLEKTEANSQVRGFVWSQIFSNLVEKLNKNE